MYKNNKILIVDDEPKNLKILSIRLEAFEISQASSGEEALDIIENFDPAIVLLDIMMDGLNGYEVTKKIKQNAKTKNCKVILVTGKASVDEKLAGYKAGAEDYLTKPFNGEELLAKVNVFMKLYNLECELMDRNSRLTDEVELKTEQLLKAERLASVGMHASEIVHNLGNPLSIIQGYIFFIKKRNPNLEKIDKLMEATNRMQTIVRDILSNVNLDVKKEMSILSVNDIITSELKFLDIINLNSKHHIAKKLQLQSQKNILATYNHISQIIGNIIRNAVDAMSKSSKKVLTVKSWDEEQFVAVSISDTGEGIAEDNKHDIFEPFYTTKKHQEELLGGTGLGLPFCKRMIESYHGQINVDSKVGIGTTITLRIPISN